MRLNQYHIFGILLALLLFPVFAHLDHLPIRIWDESRLAVNALEMYQNGNWLVTTYDNQPDLWNTKPPLLIWMQVISLKCFGLNEIAIRLPSAFAALFTCVMLFWFFAKYFKLPWLGFITCIVLITSVGYVKIHGTRTGDYDALLTLFTTSFALCYFIYIEEDKKKYLLFTFLFLTLAVFTKGIAGLMFTPALFVYTIIRKKLFHVLKSKTLFVGIAGFLLFIIGFYILRESASNGYIDAIWENEIGGRYGTTVEQHKGDGLFYITEMWKTGYTFWFILIVPGLILGLVNPNKKIRSVTLCSIVLATLFVFILSSSATKIHWYDMPAYPFYAILVAIAIYAIAGYISQSIETETPRYKFVPSLLIFFILLFPYLLIMQKVMYPSGQETLEENTRNSYLLKDVLYNRKNIDNYTLVWDEYQANYLWYWKVFKHQGRNIGYGASMSLSGNEKIVVMEYDLQKKIEKEFIALPVDSFEFVKLYHLKGKKAIGHISL